MNDALARVGAASRRAARVASGIALLGAGLTIGAPGASEGPTLFEKLAESPLVIHGRCRQEGVRATVEVLAVLKGTYKAPTLEVRYHSDNLNRDPGSQKIGFESGAESILVLEPEKSDDGRVKSETRFILAGGARGKIDLPPEAVFTLVGRSAKAE